MGEARCNLQSGEEIMEINPLSVFGLRRVSHCPPHFEKMPFDLKIDEKRITDWIYENTSGRFFSGQLVIDGKLSYCAAFENHSEASFLAFHIPELNKYSYDF